MEKVYVVLEGAPGPDGTKKPSKRFLGVADDDGKEVGVSSFSMHNRMYEHGTWNIGPLYRFDDGEVVLTREEMMLCYDLVVAKTEIIDNAEMQSMSSLGGEAYRELRRKLRQEVMS